ncbi:MAG TPA: RNA polymerase sigma factor [Patescibacteria group bacterium]|nr:RNA polymerase sigma factor [Patescibacteria group bacterium]
MNTSALQHLSDRELCRLMREDAACADGAFMEIYNRYASKVNAYCFRILNNTELAEDTFQETFLRFYQSVKNEREMTNLAGFLITIARNLCLNYKRNKLESVSIDEELLSYSDEARHDKNELLYLIHTALELLEPEFREVFVLKEYDGFSLAEIAEITGTSLANTKSRIHRAKDQIRSLLSEYIKDIQS